MNELFYKKIRTTWGIAAVIFNKKSIEQVILPGKKCRLLKDYIFLKTPPEWLKIIENKIMDYFNGIKVKFNVSQIDLANYTDFAQKVYRALSTVDYNKTISYKQLAYEAGSPNAYRAVGNIMAKNRTPLLIPCHRVTKSNGDIGGFGYGKDYKLRMLKLENTT